MFTILSAVAGHVLTDLRRAQLEDGVDGRRVAHDDWTDDLARGEWFKIQSDEYGIYAHVSNSPAQAAKIDALNAQARAMNARLSA